MKNMNDSSKELENISPEDLMMLQQIKWKLELASSKAEKALLEAQHADQERIIFILKLYLKYKLDSTCKINEVNGLIERAKKEENSDV